MILCLMLKSRTASVAHVSPFNNCRDIKPGNIMKLGQEAPNTAAALQTNVSNVSGSAYLDSTASWFKAPTSTLFGGGTTSNAELTSAIEFASIETGSGMPKSDKRATTSTPTNTVGTTADYLAASYKMIDLGTAVAVHEDEENKPADAMKTVTEIAFAG